MKKKTESTKKDNFNYHSVIRGQKSIENYFLKKYKVPYLKEDAKEKIIEIRDKIFPNYKSLKYFKKIELFKELGLKNAMKDEIKDIKIFSRNGDRLVPEEKLQIIDLIILKDIHKENLKKIEEEKEKEILKMQKEEERLKK